MINSVSWLGQLDLVAIRLQRRYDFSTWPSISALAERFFTKEIGISERDIYTAFRGDGVARSSVM